MTDRTGTLSSQKGKMFALTHVAIQFALSRVLGKDKKKKKKIFVQKEKEKEKEKKRKIKRKKEKKSCTGNLKPERTYQLVTNSMNLIEDLSLNKHCL